MVEQLLKELDEALSRLAKSDSSVEYAIHIRENFDEVISCLNAVKKNMNMNTKDTDTYF